MSAPLPRLITIPISHYGERARWALDHAGIAYDEVHHLQMFSWLASYANGGTKSLPVLVTPEGALTDSRDIVHWAHARAAVPLYPDDRNERAEIEAFEARVAGAYGVETRRAVYEWFFRDISRVLPFNAGKAPWAEVKALSLLTPFVRSFGRWHLGATSEQVERGRDVVKRTMDEIAERLKDGRRFLFGEGFTAADLTFAAMTAPMVLPPEYGLLLPRVDQLSKEVAAEVVEARRHPAGQFVLRIYAEHRSSHR